MINPIHSVDHLTLGLEPGWLLEVDRQSEGLRLDFFVSKRISRLSRAKASRLKIYQVDAHPNARPPYKSISLPLKKSTRLQANTYLWVSRPNPEENITHLPSPYIIDESPELIVLFKPSGWAVHPTASRFESTITTWLLRAQIQATPVHRLDVETSGILLCVKEPSSIRMMTLAFKKRQVHKEYLAICHLKKTRTLGDHWFCPIPLGFDKESKISIKMGRGSQESLSEFKLLSVDPTHQFGLISAIPHTGRQHQLRAHLSLSDAPIVGDKLYGQDDGVFLRYINQALTVDDHLLLCHPRHALHAHILEVQTNTVTHSWRTPLPSDLCILAQRLKISYVHLS